jgi:hypothetical protein
VQGRLGILEKVSRPSRGEHGLGLEGHGHHLVPAAVEELFPVARPRKLFCTLLMVDVDDFKWFNKKNGRLAGRALRKLASVSTGRIA